MQNKAWIVYFLLPGLCMIVSAIPMLFYKIDEPTKKLMREELALRRQRESGEEKTIAPNLEETTTPQVTEE
jgi:Na+/melibiose symporter-like transporter